ncbi:MAG: hypothetical protein KDB79_11810 [Acidobacteria bacterium]|nr:hypothetical protein [Acidobacteriota bacterium]
MKRRVLFVLGLVFVFSGLAIAQTKTITNFDLEKYKQKRLQAEKELRENYRELGFPSPKEMEKQNAESRKEMAELSQRLRAERLAREALQYEQENRVIYSDSADQPADFINYQQYYGATYTTPNYYRTRVYRNNRRAYGNTGIRINSGGVRFRGVFRSGNNNQRNANFGPSRRLTRENQIKSRQSDIRSTVRAKIN